VLPDLHQGMLSLFPVFVPDEVFVNEQLLQLKLTVAAYAEITTGIVSPLPTFVDYWNNIPEYLISRCPLCGGTYCAQLDTYSLQYWVRPEHGESVFAGFVQTIECDHFVRAHHFINLNGLKPAELKEQKTFGCEVPYVHPFWLTDDIPSFGVIHALPICRPEGERFMPRYSLYIITYYSENPAEMLERRWNAAKAWGALLTPRNFPNQAEIFNLVRWVKARKLQWLDPRDTGLPLRNKPAGAFPYANVQGVKQQRVFYPDGQVGTYPT
jgi:hypothetical protein